MTKTIKKKEKLKEKTKALEEKTNLGRAIKGLADSRGEILNILGGVDESKEKLKLDYKEIEKIDEIKTRSLDVASHEILGSMTLIMGYINLILEGKAGKISEKSKRYLEKVMDICNYQLNLVNNLLDLSKMKSGKVAMNLEEVDLSNLIEDFASEIKPLITNKDLDFKIRAWDSLPIRCDKGMLRQVMMNLWGNAIKFTQEGGKIITTISEISGERLPDAIRSTTKGKKFVMVCVEDTGIGIPSNKLHAIFDEFTQIGKNSGGVGLGLAIAKEIIESHEGKIWVESEEEKGSKFYFILPCDTT